VDAVDAGGGGDPFAVLETDEERERLAELYAAGFPLGGEWLLSDRAVGFLSWMIRADPEFVEEFWTVPGFADAGIERVQKRFRVSRTVRSAEAPAGIPTNARFVRDRIPPDAVVGVCLEGCADAQSLVGCTVVVVAGERAGMRYTGVSASGDVLDIWDPLDRRSVQADAALIEAGDEVAVDNAVAVAWQRYHRHIVDPQQPTMRRWASDGKPIWTQRPMSPDSRAVIGTLPTGRFDGKMIVVQGAYDQLCPPIFAHDYLDRVRFQDDKADDRMRLWILDHVSHGDPAYFGGFPGQVQLRVVPFMGAAMQALEDMIAWVEENKPPVPSPSYQVTAWNDVQLPAAAQDRGGIQPVVEIVVESPSGRTARVGEPVHLVARAEAPPGAGTFVHAAWDIDGSGQFRDEEKLQDSTASTIAFEMNATFDQPGTHFIVARVGTHRDGDPSDTRRRIYNLARARVLVT